MGLYDFLIYSMGGYAIFPLTEKEDFHGEDKKGDH